MKFEMIFGMLSIRLRLRLRPLIFALVFLAVQALNSGLQLGVTQADAANQCDQAFEKQSDATNWSISVYDSRITALEDFFIANKTKTVTEVIDAALKIDLRSKVFLLQSLTKTYKNTDLEFFTPLREDFKLLEDQLGQLSLARSLKAKAVELGEPALAEYFGKKEKFYESAYAAYLEKSGWLREPEVAAQKLRSKLSNFKSWPLVDTQREYLVGRLAKTLKNLHKDVKDEAFNHPDIELGLHELRRQLRWLGLQVQSFQGIVQLQSTELEGTKLRAWYQKMKKENPNLDTNKYAVLSAALVEKPVLIPQQYYVMLSQLIGELGTFKDGAETEIYFREALEETKSSAATTRKVMKKLRSTLGESTMEFDHQKLSAATETQLRETKFFKKFSEALESMD